MLIYKVPSLQALYDLWCQKGAVLYEQEQEGRERQEGKEGQSSERYGKELRQPIKEIS